MRGRIPGPAVTPKAASGSLLAVRPFRVLPLVLSLSALVACGAPPPPAHPVGEGASCPGRVEPADGLAETPDEALLKQALGDPGKGKLCAGKVFTAVRAVTVYRVWNKAKPYTQLGSWWSLAKPAGPVDRYRADNAICPEWSELDTVSECKLKVGAKVVVGPGQSAACDKGLTFPPSATNQVFVPNETRDPANQKVYVEGCSPGAVWP